MAVLRSPDGCPWDRQQTHATLRTYLLEETYEALDAIDRGDMAALCDELGDVLLQVVFHAELAAGAGAFTIQDVVDAIVRKLIRRHPHVFTPAGRRLTPAARRRRAASTPDAVVEQWQQIKARERASTRRDAGLLAGIPPALPALAAAHRIGGRAARVGFDWPDAMDVVDKIDEEVRELRAALREGAARMADEMGDLLFSIANLARKLAIDPESALRGANEKFRRRFAEVERRLARAGRTIDAASPDEMEAAWRAVKQAHAARSRRATSARSSSGRARRGRRSR
jgi:MazG family protein